MIVVLIMGILIGIAVPQFYKARESGRKSQCLGNLKIMDNAKEQWAMDNKKTTGDSCSFTDLVGATNYIKNMPVCPSGGTYDLRPVSSFSTCSFTGHVLP